VYALPATLLDLAHAFKDSGLSEFGPCLTLHSEIDYTSRPHETTEGHRTTIDK
jgi:hypothetical protein